MKRTLLLFLSAASLLAGCTVGPDYSPPEAAVPAEFAEPIPQGASDAVDPAHWWSAFGDPELDTLIAAALRDNPDIATAVSRIRQARLQEISARAQGLPTLDAAANANYLRFSKNAGLSNLTKLFGGGSGSGDDSGSGGGIALPGDSITTYAAGFDARWELDLFGRRARGIEAADARTEQALWSARDAAVTLAAEIADNYLQLRYVQAQEAIVNDQITSRKRIIELAGETAQVGLVPQGNVVEQRAALSQTQASLEPLRAEEKLRMHALGTLIGQPPSALVADLATSRPLADAPAVPPGLPSELLRRRPDVRAAERQLAAATADIGIAVADLYPRFNLTGMAQLISTALGNLFEGDSLQLTGAGAATFPILDWGQRRAAVDLRREQRIQAYNQYRATVLGALRDVEDALAQLDTERRRNAVLHQGVTDAQRVAQTVEARFQSGFVAQDAVMNARISVLDAQNALATSDAALRQDTVALYKALGGGWQQADLDARAAATPEPPDSD